MDPIKTINSKVWPTVIASAIVLVTAGTASVLYVRDNQSATVAPSPVVTTPKTTILATDPVITAGATVTTTLGGLDSDLAKIDSDLKSTDDTSPTL